MYQCLRDTSCHNDMENGVPFLVLGANNLGARGARNYRGTCRERPPFATSLPADGEYNALFSWYCEAGGESGAVNDVAKAVRLTQLLRQALDRKEFELVEAVRAGDSVRLGGELLGYDLSCAWAYSLLSWGLDLSVAITREELPVAVRNLLALVEAHFKPLLNEHGLFRDERIATFCLQSMMALQAFRPGLWENEDSSDFEVVAVFKVADTELAAKGTPLFGEKSRNGSE